MKREMVPCPHHNRPIDNTCNCASCMVKNPINGTWQPGICRVCHGTGVVPKLGTICHHHNFLLNTCVCASCIVKNPLTGNFEAGICKVCKGIGTI